MLQITMLDKFDTDPRGTRTFQTQCTLDDHGRIKNYKKAPPIYEQRRIEIIYVLQYY